jgi:hypothetical protein
VSCVLHLHRTAQVASMLPATDLGKNSAKNIVVEVTNLLEIY